MANVNGSKRVMDSVKASGASAVAPVSAGAAAKPKSAAEEYSDTRQISPFGCNRAFVDAYRMANCLAASDIVPDTFRNKAPNCMVALELANRMKTSVFQIMQHLYIIHGRPGFSSQFVIAAIQSCGRYSALKYKWRKDAQGRPVGCQAYARELASGETLEGPEVTMEMAQQEGWSGKAGSKWKTMPQVMMMYRAAAFFGRLYAPDVLMGMQTQEELDDIGSGAQMPEAEITASVVPAEPAPAKPNKPVEPEIGDVIDAEPEKPEERPMPKSAREKLADAAELELKPEEQKA